MQRKTTKAIEYPEWFFMWSKPPGSEYITRLCGWTKAGLKYIVESDHKKSWKKIYSEGGRIVRVKITVVDDKKQEKSSAHKRTSQKR